MFHIAFQWRNILKMSSFINIQLRVSLESRSLSHIKISSSIQIHGFFSSTHGKINYFNEPRCSSSNPVYNLCITQTVLPSVCRGGAEKLAVMILAIGWLSRVPLSHAGYQNFDKWIGQEFRIWVKCHIHFIIKKLFAVQHYLLPVFI